MGTHVRYHIDEPGVSDSSVIHPHSGHGAGCSLNKAKLIACGIPKAVHMRIKQPSTGGALTVTIVAGLTIPRIKSAIAMYRFRDHTAYMRTATKTAV